MATSGRVFRGTPQDLALWQPWVGPALPIKEGVPIGIDLRTGRVVMFDPWLLKLRGVIDSTIFMVVGNKGAGKSTLMKSLIIRLSSFQAGIRDGEPDEIRTFIHDRKPEDGEGEYAPVSRFLASRPFKLNQDRLVNIFDPRMFKPDGPKREFNLLDVAINVCELISGRSLVGLETMALQVAINKMVKDFSTTASPEVLEMVLRSLNLSDVERYFEGSNQQVTNAFHSELDGDLDLFERLGLIMSRPHNIDFQRFASDAAQMSECFGRLREEYGGMFGGNGSLREVLASPVVTWDWTGVSDKARTLLEAMLMRWRLAALDNNEPELIPHLDFGDEEHEAFGNLMHVRFRASIVKKARAFHTASFTGTQYTQDLTHAGDEGSERRALAEGIIRGTGAWFIGRQPRDRKILDVFREMGMMEPDIDALTRIGTGCFALMIPNRHPIFFQNVLTPTELSLVGTDSAVQRMTSRQVVTVPDGYANQAKAFGVTYIGEGES